MKANSDDLTQLGEHLDASAAASRPEQVRIY